MTKTVLTRPVRPHIKLLTESAIATFFRQPLFIGAVLFSYYYFVRKCGPEWMEKRKAFELRTLMLVYNAFQVLYNLALLLFVWHRPCVYQVAEFTINNKSTTTTI